MQEKYKLIDVYDYVSKKSNKKYFIGAVYMCSDTSHELLRILIDESDVKKLIEMPLEKRNDFGKYIKFQWNNYQKVMQPIIDLTGV